MKKIRHTYDSITLTICFCTAAMVCGLLSFAIVMSDFPAEPGIAGIDMIVAKIGALILPGGATIAFVIVACAALADGRRTINSPSDLDSLMD